MLKRLWGTISEEEGPEGSVNCLKLENSADKNYAISMTSNGSGDSCSTASWSRITIKLNNPLITQTIEVMQQTEMLQSLIDTYSNKSGSSNYLLNPLQVIPEVHFPPENVADFLNETKFLKPIWFIPPIDTAFTSGAPHCTLHIDNNISRSAIRKAVSGQLRVAGFTDTVESALVFFTDAVEEFVKSFLEQIRDVNVNNDKETQSETELATLEKAYYLQTNKSIISCHNYFKHHLITRNRAEIAEFDEVLHEYDKLMKQSQFMQKDEFQECDFLNILEMPQSNEAVGGVIQDIVSGNGVLFNGFDQQFNGAFKDVFQANISENNINGQQMTDDMKQEVTEVTCFMLQSHD